MSGFKKFKQLTGQVVGARTDDLNDSTGGNHEDGADRLADGGYSTRYPFDPSAINKQFYAIKEGLSTADDDLRKPIKQKPPKNKAKAKPKPAPPTNANSARPSLYSVRFDFCAPPHAMMDPVSVEALKQDTLKMPSSVAVYGSVPDSATGLRERSWPRPGAETATMPGTSSSQHLASGVTRTCTNSNGNNNNTNSSTAISTISNAIWRRATPDDLFDERRLLFSIHGLPPNDARYGKDTRRWISARLCPPGADVQAGPENWDIRLVHKQSAVERAHIGQLYVENDGRDIGANVCKGDGGTSTAVPVRHCNVQCQTDSTQHPAPLPRASNPDASLAQCEPDSSKSDGGASTAVPVHRCNVLDNPRCTNTAAIEAPFC